MHTQLKNLDSPLMYIYFGMSLILLCWAFRVMASYLLGPAKRIVRLVGKEFSFKLICKNHHTIQRWREQKKSYLNFCVYVHILLYTYIVQLLGIYDGLFIYIFSFVIGESDWNTKSQQCLLPLFVWKEKKWFFGRRTLGKWWKVEVKSILHFGSTGIHTHKYNHRMKVGVSMVFHFRSNGCGHKMNFNVTASDTTF